MLIALAGLLALSIVALVAVTVHSRLAPGPTLVGKTLSVHQQDGTQHRGLLHGQHADRWVLRDAYVVTSVGDQAAGGLVHIPTAGISWIQEIEQVKDR